MLPQSSPDLLERVQLGGIRREFYDTEVCYPLRNIIAVPARSVRNYYSMSLRLRALGALMWILSHYFFVHPRASKTSVSPVAGHTAPNK